LFVFNRVPSVNLHKLIFFIFVLAFLKKILYIFTRYEFFFGYRGKNYSQEDINFIKQLIELNPHDSRHVGEHLKYLVFSNDQPIDSFTWSSAPDILDVDINSLVGQPMKENQIFI